MYKLRPDQQKAVNEIILGFKEYRSQVFVGGCGIGKSVIGADLLHRSAQKNRKSIFLVDNNSILEGMVKTLTFAGLDYGLISATSEPNYDDYTVFLGSFQTLESRPHWLLKNFGFIILDEAHETAWRQGYSTLLEHNPNAYRLLLTATPWRLSKLEWFRDKVTNAVIGESTQNLIKMGALVDYEFYSLERSTDWSKIPKQNGEFQNKAVSVIVNSDRVINGILDKALHLMQDKLSIAFCQNVDHTINAARVANERGIKSAIFTGSTSKDERKEILRKMEYGDIQILFSCKSLQKGFDFPAIECGLDMAPTTSMSNAMQRIGRVGRASQGKTKGIYIDCVANLDRLIEFLGCFPQEYVHTKESVLAATPYTVGDPPVKVCPQCDRIIRIFNPTCPYCQYDFPKFQKELVELAGEFTQILSPKRLKELNNPDLYKEHFRKLIRKSYEKTGCPSGAWTEYQKAKFPKPYDRPKKEWGKGAIFGGDMTKVHLFRQSVVRFAHMIKKTDSWFIESQVELEFGKIEKPAKVC